MHHTGYDTEEDEDIANSVLAGRTVSYPTASKMPSGLVHPHLS